MMSDPSHIMQTKHQSRVYGLWQNTGELQAMERLRPGCRMDFGSHTDCDIHILVCVDYSVEQSGRQRKLSRLQCPCYNLVALMFND